MTSSSIADLNTDQALRAACRRNDTEQALALLDAGADPLYNNASAFTWCAFHGNRVVLDRLLSEYTLEPDFLFSLLQSSVSNDIFGELHSQWAGNLTAEENNTLLFKAARAASSATVGYLIERHPPSAQTRAELARALAERQMWGLFDKVVEGLNTPVELHGVVLELSKHSQTERLQKVAPLIAWSSAHYTEMANVFAHYPAMHALIEAALPVGFYATCDVLLQYGLKKDADYFRVVLEQVTDPATRGRCLFVLLHHKKTGHLHALMDVATDLETHLMAASHATAAHKEFFYQELNIRQNQRLRDSLGETAGVSPRVLKL